MDLSFSTGQAFWALLTSQARKEAELEQLKGMVEEIYADIKNEDLDELKAKSSETFNNLYQKKLRLVFSDAGMNKQNIDTILDQV